LRLGVRDSELSWTELYLYAEGQTEDGLPVTRFMGRESV
ncbi:MAG: hypothetical protein QOG99_2283, partial [Frankiales bacterium]|nr:hypothetical protein [Frankiales bacterium]